MSRASRVVASYSVYRTQPVLKQIETTTEICIYTCTHIFTQLSASRTHASQHASRPARHAASQAAIQPLSRNPGRQQGSKRDLPPTSVARLSQAVAHGLDCRRSSVHRASLIDCDVPYLPECRASGG